MYSPHLLQKISGNTICSFELYRELGSAFVSGSAATLTFPLIDMIGLVVGMDNDSAAGFAFFSSLVRCGEFSPSHYIF